MRKRIIGSVQQETEKGVSNWLDLAELVDVEITSEDIDYPIENALITGKDSGWRAAESGKQTIRLIFSQPQQIKRIRVDFEEAQQQRTQEYFLRWSSSLLEEPMLKEIVRQQWNFSPDGGAIRETEDHQVELASVTILELQIIPEISGGDAIASLLKMQIA